MNLRITTILKVLGLSILAFLVIIVASTYWLGRTADTCWKQEAAEAFQKYGSLKTRTDILQAASFEKDPGSNPLEVIEKDPNGCSFGSNGQAVLRFSFNDRKKLTTLQVFRNYIASDYKMELIEERRY